MFRRCFIGMMTGAMIFATPALAHKHRDSEQAPLTIHSELVCLNDRDNDNQWIEEWYSPTRIERYCEHIGPYKERPVTVEFFFSL